MASNDLLREAGDPNTAAGRLQEIAQLDQSTWAVIAANPAAYPGLLEWLGQHGDAAVTAAIAARSVATPPAPPAPAAPPVPPVAPPVPQMAAPAVPAMPTVGVAGGYPVPEKKRNTGLIATIVVLGVALLVGGGIWLFMALNNGGNQQATPNPPGVDGPQLPGGELPGGGGIEVPTPPGNPAPNPVSGDVCQQLVTATLQWGQANQGSNQGDAMSSIGGLYKAWGDAISDPQLKSDMYLIADMMEALTSGDYTKFVNNAEADAAMDRMTKAVEGCEDVFNSIDGMGSFGF